MHPKHVDPVDNNLQYTKFPNVAHFLDMVVLWDPPFISYNRTILNQSNFNLISQWLMVQITSLLVWGRKRIWSLNSQSSYGFQQGLKGLPQKIKTCKFVNDYMHTQEDPKKSLKTKWFCFVAGYSRAINPLLFR